MHQSTSLVAIVVGLATALFFALIISIAPSRASVDPFPRDRAAPDSTLAPALDPRQPCLIPGAPCTWARTFGGVLEDKAL